MRKSFLALAAAALCCLSCIEINYGVGSGLIPQNQRYKIYTRTIPIENITMEMADSLSGYSNTRITVGAVRDDLFGLTTRTGVITLIPMFQDTLDLGKNQIYKGFHFAAARDTLSSSRADQEHIFQTFRVYELAEPTDVSVNYDCNRPVEHLGENLAKSTIIYNGGDSLSFNFSDEFGKRCLEDLAKNGVGDIDSYLERFPGIYIEADAPAGDGGRINMFRLQVDYDSKNYYIRGNHASLNFSAEFDGVRKDTTLMFYYGATDFYDLDSLFRTTGNGSFPQYALNLTSQETEALAGQAGEKLYVEGGGGLKPRITGLELKHLAEDAIREAGGDPATSVINKASVILPFEFPEDYNDMDHWPQVLSPTCRIITEPDEDGEGGMATFMSLSDSSDENANLGDVNRSTLKYSPDITYHVQSLVRIDENDTSDEQTKKLLNGSYDVWFLIMANELIETTDVSSSSTNDLYRYLAYQNYYNNIYGYGGYGYGYGYGGYSDYYSNYYTYAMLAAMYSNANTTTQTETVMLDKDRYYNAALNGPDYPDESLVPQLRITFAIPMEEADY